MPYLSGYDAFPPSLLAAPSPPPRPSPPPPALKAVREWGRGGRRIARCYAPPPWSMRYKSSTAHAPKQ